MRTELDHLPPQKQRELERVVQLIFEEFDDAFALAKHEWKKAGRILKVILYGRQRQAAGRPGQVLVEAR